MGKCKYLVLLTSVILCVRRIETQQVTVNDVEGNIDFTNKLLKESERLRGVSTDNNRKPMFTECHNYTASVREEQPAGTFVIKIKAQDDDPPNAGGTVRYRIVRREGGRDYFSIDNVTGEVRTMMPFDRDEPLRQKELYLNIQATDNGWPPLSDICTFKVIVTDINDNPPQLDQQVYTAQVAEDLKRDSEVMRIFAYDIDDGVNSKLTYNFQDTSKENSKFLEYFRIDADTGVVYLQQTLASRRGTKFTTTVRVRDNGVPVMDTEANVSIIVVGSDKQPPRIISRTPDNDIILKESFNDYQAHLVTIVAESSISDKEVAFELIKGKTMQTNKDQTFVLTPSTENAYTAYITLARPLDYETVVEYTLSVRIKNKDLMDTSINIPIKIEDVNDELPNFMELITGSVVENDDSGAQAMVVRAIDKDGTSANNIVSYELLTHTEAFEIDRSSGVIKSKVSFDRENISVYHVKVRAYDNSPSALKTRTEEPNEAVQTFQISIEDRNDNNPKFTHSLYNCTDILENTDIGKDVGEVVARDKDSASLITYSIIDGNIDDAFFIENTTGRIKVNKQLDYEKIEKYLLTVRAFDGIFEDTAMVAIFIANVNDEAPVFEEYNKIIRIQEEKIPPNCIITVKAYDPDIKDRNADQHIVYGVDSTVHFLQVDSDGCVKLTKPLDRDRPFGSPSRQAYIYAHDNDGTLNSVTAAAEIMIELDDINDNAPFLNVTVVVWYENQEVLGTSIITRLSADDYDGPENGPPFTYKLADEASSDIISKFQIVDDELYALVTFDREEQKYYDIPILVTDSGNPPQSSVSILRVIIGDRNDNAAKDGSSEIFVYKYEKLNTEIAIGRVYVDDPDDWDLPDKIFIQLDNFDYFTLSSEDPGMIIMSPTVPAGEYPLRFNVTEENEPIIPRHTVSGSVMVTVQDLPEIAVRRSGSIRMEGITMEDLLQKDNSKSKKDLLQQRIAEIVNTSVSNVDVFTVLPSPSNHSLVDVRFSAHGSPYYAPERLNNKITMHQATLEKELNVDFVMISINECLNETVCGEGNSCSNKLDIYEEPAVVFTNRSSFVGVKAIVKPDCSCLDRSLTTCYNGGTYENGVCICPSEFEGPFCERLSIGFNGDGWAMYPGLDACNTSHITLSVAPSKDDGLIFFAGPLSYRHALLSKDFISLELKSGSALLKIDTGLGPREIEIAKKLNDGATHKIRISFIYTKTDTTVELEIDDCKSNCLKVTSVPQGLLSINGPLQIGGLSQVFTEEQEKLLWGGIAPTEVGFGGCIKNFTYNGFYYNLGEPSDQSRAFPNCNYALQQAVTFGIDSNFLVAILVCIAVLFILLLAVVVHRRQQDSFNEKDIDDTTENIINYEDEGGGESDAHYDLTVFSKPPIKDTLLQSRDISDNNATEPISIFLDNKKDSCDKDPDNLPYDDVRHYAYEGDGNSTGSLSSLGSCTDDGDLDFNYLFSFGKRFSKLADMYDNDGSDDDY